MGSVSSPSLTPQQPVSVPISLLKLTPKKPPVIFQLGNLMTFYSASILVSSLHFLAFLPAISLVSLTLLVPRMFHSLSLILLLCPPSPAFDSSSSLNPLHDILQNPILGLFLSFNFLYLKISAFTSSWMVIACYLPSVLNVLLS